MIYPTLSGATLISALILVTPLAVAQDRTQQQTQEQMIEQEQIFGSQLMTQQERAEYRQKLRAATTEDEREQIRQEHHARMTQRAEEMGMKLPDEPPARAMRDGMGDGMGPGSSGMGGGRGR